MSTSETLLPQFDQEMANTRKLLECVPEDKFAWKPHEKSMTLGRLASHVAEMPQWAAMTVNTDKLDLTPDMKPFNAANKAELIEAFNSNVSAGREAIAGAGDEHLTKTWTLLFQGNLMLSMPRIDVLRSTVMSHMIHHRGQLSVYLRLLDVPIPGMYGPSADNK
jgi:uncharacterized damage-inducible protein DinB